MAIDFQIIVIDTPAINVAVMFRKLGNLDENQILGCFIPMTIIEAIFIPEVAFTGSIAAP